MLNNQKSDYVFRYWIREFIIWACNVVTYVYVIKYFHRKLTRN